MEHIFYGVCTAITIWWAVGNLAGLFKAMGSARNTPEAKAKRAARETKWAEWQTAYEQSLLSPKPPTPTAESDADFEARAQENNFPKPKHGMRYGGKFGAYGYDDDEADAGTRQC